MTWSSSQKKKKIYAIGILIRVDIFVIYDGYNVKYFLLLLLDMSTYMFFCSCSVSSKVFLWITFYLDIIYIYTILFIFVGHQKTSRSPIQRIGPSLYAPVSSRLKKKWLHPYILYTYMPMYIIAYKYTIPGPQQ